MAHVPFLLSDDGAYADLHLVRSNPIARVGAGRAVMVVSGPDGYVSPDWYGVPDQIPTWNYVAVHLAGTLAPLPCETLSDLIDRQSAFFEDQLRHKTPWTAEKMSDGVKDRMMRAILPFRLAIESVDGTWKLNQNKDDAVRKNAADQIETGVGTGLGLLSQMMRNA